MSDHELEKIRLKKAEMLMKLSALPKEVIKIHSVDEFNKILNDFDKIISRQYGVARVRYLNQYLENFRKNTRMNLYL